MLFASTPPHAQAAAFGRPRHLFRRIELIAKERIMSTRRVVVSFGIVAMLVTGGTWFSLRTFPLMAAAPGVAQLTYEPGPLERAARPITPENPIPRRINAVAVPYPFDLIAHAAGSVAIKITLDASGRVAEMRPVGFFVPRAPGVAAPDGFGELNERFVGPERASPVYTTLDAFLRAASSAVSLWAYDPPANAPLSFYVHLAFPAGKDAVLLDQTALLALPPAPAMNRALGITPPPPPPPPPASPNSALGSLQEPSAPVRVGGRVTAPRKTKHVDPIYPAAAIADGVQGVVIIEAVISTEGLVTSARVLRPIEALNQAAVDAVKQWEYTPTLLNGQPVSIIMSVTVNFVLPEPARE